MGGEGEITPSTGIFYPFVTDVLAKRFGAAVIEPEHRYYGTSLPYGAESFTDANLLLATPQQALADAASFITAKRAEFGCDPTPGSAGYCPVVTIGGSYPGWLSAMMRLRYPAVVDMAYSASAPMYFYTQEVGEYEYYELITQSAEKAVPGCAKAVRASMAAFEALSDQASVVEAMNLCEPLPDYMNGEPNLASLKILKEEVSMVVMYTFAGLNMGNYPPGPDTGLSQACEAFVFTTDEPDDDEPLAALKSLLNGYAETSLPARRHGFRHGRANRANTANVNGEGACFSMQGQVPDYDVAGTHNQSVTCGDWSGCGVGSDGGIWDFQTSTFLVEHIGCNGNTDMFTPRNWSMDWLNGHSMDRFGTTPQPRALADLWGFDKLAEMGATKIVFTNGLNDGWSVGGVKSDLSDTLLAINIEDGAHHSDLSHSEPSDADTADVRQARARVGDILAGWLEQAKIGVTAESVDAHGKSPN